jgi:hypothetical protein
MVGIALTYLCLRILVLRKRKRLLELISISMVDIAPPILVTDSTGILAAWQTLGWLYVNSCASTVHVRESAQKSIQ